MLLYGDQQYHLLTSTDLLHWTDTGNVVPDSFECPDFFELPLDGRRDQVGARAGRWEVLGG